MKSFLVANFGEQPVAAVEHLIVNLESASARQSACAIPLSEVREVLTLQVIHFVPGCKHPSVQGLSMVRGDPALVVDLGIFMGMKRARENPLAVMVISDLDRSVQAFIVREVVGIEKIDVSQVQDVGLTTSGVPRHVATLPDGTLAAILSLQGVLDRLGEPEPPKR